MRIQPSRLFQLKLTISCYMSTVINCQNEFQKTNRNTLNHAIIITAHFPFK